MESVEHLSAPLFGQRLVDCPQQQPDGAPVVLLAVVGLAFFAALAELGLYALAEEPLDPVSTRVLRVSKSASFIVLTSSGSMRPVSRYRSQAFSTIAFPCSPAAQRLFLAPVSVRQQ